jgi:hypothetical protein
MPLGQKANRLNGTRYAVTVDYFSYLEEKLGRRKRL